VFPETSRPIINSPELLYYPYAQYRYKEAKRLTQQISLTQEVFSLPESIPASAVPKSAPAIPKILTRLAPKKDEQPFTIR